jgi:hypothetical protein
MPRILTVIVLLIVSSFLNAQTKGIWQVGAYTNVLAFNATADNGNFVREVSTGSNDVLKSHAYQWSVGTSVERMLKKTLFLSSGLYYSQFQTTTFNRSGIGSYYFYALVNENNSQVEYASVDRIYTVRDYFTVPLEIRYEPAHTGKAAFFLKGSVVTQFAVGNSSQEISMNDNSTYNGGIAFPNHYANNRSTFFSGYATMGLRIGRLHNVNGRIEFGVPIPFSRNAGPYNLRIGTMASTTLYYPLGKK